MSIIKEKFQRLFDLAGDGILLLQRDKFIDCNPRAAEILGYSNPKELIGLHAFDISPKYLPDGTSSKEYSYILNKAAYRNPINFEWTHLDKLGSSRIIEVTLTLFDKDDDILLVHWRDITERKALESKVVEAASLFEEAEQLAKVGGWKYQDKAIILSKFTASILNLSPETPYSVKRILSFFNQANRRLLTSHIKNRKQLKIPYHVDVKTKPIDGKQYWVRVSCKWKLLNQRATNIVGALLDITEIVKTQEKEKEKDKQIKNGHFFLMRAMSLAMEKRDPYTAGHQNNVANLSREIALDMGLDSFTIEGLVLGATLHDLGKIAIPIEILTRPGEISVEEIALIRRHSIIGYQIIKDVDFPWPIAEMVRQHHERIDGSGYPEGLTGSQIILEARIIAVADVIEAMSSNRPYRAALGLNQAIQEIRNGKGSKYDSDVVDACLNVFENGFRFQ